MADVNVTYETLFEILRNEKNREDIQELSPTFYNDVIAYLNKNKNMLNEIIAKNAPDDEKEDMLRQIKNIKNLIKEIYERREKKIINLALNKSRTKIDNMEADILLPEEREFYTLSVKTLDLFRNRILTSALNGNTPETAAAEPKVDMPEIQKQQPRPEPNQQSEPEQSKPETPEKPPVEKPTETQSEDPSKKSIKFKETVPKFLGKELEVYGPYDPEETASLPVELANILISKGKAEEIKEMEA